VPSRSLGTDRVKQSRIGSRCYPVAPSAVATFWMSADHDVTALLDHWSRGDPQALDRLMPFVYRELRAIAARQLRQERRGHTLQPTALVHEAYFRLVEQRNVDWQNRAHFFGVAAKVMRRILVDHGRRQAARKRNDNLQRVPLEDIVDRSSTTAIPILVLDLVLAKLERVDPGLAQLVELRAFGGLTIQEAAHVLKVSPSTIKRDWRTAKAWLTRELGEDPERS
jgi:RNA polymerase sigma factor (TIGR02999 family)